MGIVAIVITGRILENGIHLYKRLDHARQKRVNLDPVKYSDMKPSFLLLSLVWVFLLATDGCSQNTELPYAGSWYKARSTFGNRYDLFYPLTAELAKVCNDGRCGLIDRYGREVLPLDYEIQDHFFGALLVIGQGGKYGAVNAVGKPVIPVRYAETMLHFDSKSMVGVRNDSLWAVFDTAGRQLTPFRFTDIEYLVGQYAVASTTGRAYVGAWGPDGRNIVPERYHELVSLPAGYWQARYFGKCALLGSDGKERTPFQYEELLGMPDESYYASSFRQDNLLYHYSKSGQKLSDSPYPIGKIGSNAQISISEHQTVLMDHTGNLVKIPGECWLVEPQPGDPVDWIRLSGGGEEESLGWYDLKTGHYQPPAFFHAVVSGDRVIASGYAQTSIFSRRGQLLNNFSFTVFPSANDRVWITQTEQGLYGLCDSNLKTLVDPREGILERNAWGGFTRTNPDGVQVYDPDGKEIYTTVHLEEFIPDIRRNYAVFKSNERYGVVRIDGMVVLPTQYEYAEAVAHNRFIVRKNGKSGLVDGNGTALLQQNFDLVASTPGEQRLQLQKDGKYGIASAATGKLLLPVAYDNLKRFSHFIITERNGKFGLYDENLQVILPERFEHISWWNDLWLIAENGRRGILNKDLNIVLPVDYEQINFKQSPIVALRHGVTTRWVRIGTRLKPAAENTFFNWQAGMAVKLENGRYGLYDRRLDPILPGSHDQIMPVGQAGVMAIVRDGSNAACISPEKAEVVTFKADSLLNWQDEYLFFRRAGKRWIRNLLTRVEIPVPEDGALEILRHTSMILLKTKNQAMLYDAHLEKGPVWQGESLYQHTWNTRMLPFYIGKKDGKTGLLSASAKVVLPFEYDRFHTSETYYSPYLWLEKDSKRGVFNCANGHLLPAIYDNFEWVDTSGFVIASQGGQYALFSPGYDRLTDFNLESAGLFGQGYFWVKRDGKMIILNRDGHIMPASSADELDIWPENGGAFFRVGDAWGFIRFDGKIVLEPRYAALNALGKLAIQAYLPEGKSRIYTTNGQPAGADVFDNVLAVDDRHFLIRKDELSGIIDLNGRYSIPLQAGYLYCEGNACIVPKGEKQGLYRPDGTVLLPPVYDNIQGSEDGEGIFTTRQGNRFGFVNGDGRWIANPEFDYARPFDAGLAAVRRNGKWGFIDTLGRVAIPFRYDFAWNFRNYTRGAVVLHEKTFQLIDNKGNIIGGIPYGTEEDPDDYFQNQPEPYRQAGNGQGLKYSQEDAWLLQPTGYRLWSPVCGLVIYGADKDPDCFLPPYGLMNYAGQKITPMIYGALRTDHLKVCDMIPANLGAKWGFLNTAGETVILFEYDNAWNLPQPWENGEWRGGVHKDGRSWIIDRTGRKVRDQ